MEGSRGKTTPVWLSGKADLSEFKSAMRNRAEISESAQRLGTQQGELLATAPSRQLNLVLRLRQRVAGFLASKPDLRQETLTRISNRR